LGNFKVNPKIGMTIPDFNTADVLYLTGSASILVGKEASSLLARSNLAIKITVTEARFVKSGLPFRGDAGEYSPYNPPVRHLLSEHDAHLASSSAPSKPNLSASLVRREVLTPTINRYTFQLSSRDVMPKWQAGQYITFDFEPELGAGYSHMRDEDPQSLNDDLIRTFTVSSPPIGGSEIQMTLRRHGPATTFLGRHNTRVPLEIPVLGFGGEEAFRIPLDPQAPQPIFIAAGVGITPMLAQAQAVLDAKVPLRLLWSLRSEDLSLAVDTFARVPALAGVTTLFVTGGRGEEERGAVERLGTGVEIRRMARGDLEKLRGSGDERGANKKKKFFLCTGPALLAALGEWLEGEEVVWEDFGY
jgi:ferredoxin-NADP reductase